MNIRLSAGQFLTLVADNEYVRDFSWVAQQAIVQTIEDQEQGEHDFVDWTAWFQTANEVDDFDDVPEEHREGVMTLGNGNYLWFD